MKTIRSKIIVFGSILLILIIGILFITQSMIGNELYQVTNYNDFNFRLDFGYGGDQIDTYNNTFTKDLIIDGSITIDFVLPESIKKDVFEIMREIDIMSYPDKLTEYDIIPPCSYKLEVTINKKIKTIVWKQAPPAISDLGTKKEKEFLRLVKYVEDYIISTDEYKSLPEAHGFFE
jgi:hypothetical protein